METILRVDLYGTAMLLEEMRTHIAEGGVGVTISSQSGFRMPQLTAEEDALLAETPAEELLSLEMLQPGQIRDTLHAYQLAKRCNEKRVMAEAVHWGERGARINADELEGRIYYRFHIFDGRRRNSIVFLRTAETGSGINSDEI